MKNMRDLNQKSERSNFTWIASLMIFGIACVIAGFVIAAGMDVIPETRAENVSTARMEPQTIQSGGTDILFQTQESFRSIVSAAKPAVVTIETKKESKNMPFNISPHDNRFFFDPFMRPENTPQNEEEKNYDVTGGSGFFVSPEGYVLTNNHVVSDSVEISVITDDQNSYKAELVGTDPKTDVALLKISGNKSFPYLELGNSENAQIGDWVIAIGSPIRLAQTVTVGVISGKNREDVHIGNIDYSNFLQTDAAINFGNSGGPLLDIYGKVIGINTAIAGGANVTGIGFAIPVNLARFAYENLKAHGEVIRAWIGVTIQPVDSDMALIFGLDKPMGALVNSVVTGDPADKAGIKVGDLIVEIDGVEVPTNASLSRMIAEKKVGAPIKLKILREKKEITVTVTPTRRPENAETIVMNKEAPVEQESIMGLTLSELDDTWRSKLGVPGDISGVLVMKVKKNSKAADKMIFEYDIITEVNNVPVNSVSGCKSAIAGAKDVVLLKVYSQNVTGGGWTGRYVAVPLD